MVITNSKTETLRSIGFGIVGVASHHSEYIPKALQNISSTFLVGVYDEDRDRAARFCSKFNTHLFSSLDELLEDPRVEIGVVTSENARKAEFAIALARANKHVLCDKPLGVKARESRAVISACESHGVVLQVGYLSRYIDEVQQARNVAASGRLGDVRFINAENRVDSGLVKQLSPWLVKKDLTGGGSLVEHSVHAIDLALWFSESPLISVYAVEAQNLDSTYEAEDNFAILLHFKNDSLALIDGSYCRPSSGRRGDVVMDVKGKKAQLHLSLTSPELREYLGEDPQTQKSSYGIKGASSEESSSERMIQDLLNSVMTGSAPLADGRAAEKVNVVVDAAYKSLDTGEEVKVRI